MVVGTVEFLGVHIINIISKVLSDIDPVYPPLVELLLCWKPSEVRPDTVVTIDSSLAASWTEKK